MNRPTGANKGFIALVVVIFVIAGMGTCAYVGLRNEATPPPDFPRLTDLPDPNLHGTVAYLDEATLCVRAIAASGAAAKEVYCLEEKEGLFGPALTWLPDGRLEMIAYEWPTDEPMRAVWRRIVDIATLEVEEASLDGIGDIPRPTAAPGVSPSGQRVIVEAAGGDVRIAIDDGTATRTVMAGSGNSGYGLNGPPIWSPDWKWLLVNDDRLLVVMTEREWVRVLVDAPLTFIDEAGIVAWAVTGADLLAAG